MRILSIIVVLLGMATFSLAEAPTAALYGDEDSGMALGLVAALERELAATGYAVTVINGAALCNSHLLDTTNFSLLILPDAKSLPMRSIDPVHRFLQQGGNVVALNTPAWRERLVFMDGA